jgi:uncharacterized protein (TIGR03435 family)
MTNFTRSAIAVACVFGCLSSGLVVHAQTPVLRFEAASIKPNRSAITPAAMGIGPVGPASGPMGCHGTDRGPQTIPLGRCVFKNVTAGFLISVIGILDEKEYQLGQVPDWVTSEGFDIDAKAEEPVTQKQLAGMLITLLAERFNCKFRRETREVSGFVMTVARGGAKLTKSSNQESQSEREAEASIALPARLSPQRPALMVGNKAGMATLARFITRFWTAPVVDRTDLAGFYDFQLRWQPDDNSAAAPVERTGPSFTTALDEQLGLRLQSQKVPVEFLRIDHIEKPSVN